MWFLREIKITNLLAKNIEYVEEPFIEGKVF